MGDGRFVLRLPPGVRDLLPQAAARRRGIVAALTGEFERWGYRAIITPIYEYDEVLRRGLGAPARAVRFVEPHSGEILSLRPDLTPQVARLVATRLHDEPGPLRLFYEGSVVRVPDGARGQGELFQVGVELIDAPSEGGDLEAITLAEAALAAAGVSAARLDLGHAAVARAALDGLALDDAAEAALLGALERKDAAEVARLAARTGAPARRRRLLSALPTLYGGPEVVAHARRLVDGGAARAALDGLGRLVARLGALGPAARLSVDLGELRGFRYYTGTRFALYAPGVGTAVSSGGRYDALVERYGRAARATGFAVDVDAVAEVQQASGRGLAPPAPGVLVAGEPLDAARLAARVRGRGRRAVLALEPPGSDAALRAEAARRGLGRVLVVGPRGLRWRDSDGAGRGRLGAAALRALCDGDGGDADWSALLPGPC
jgi:ATP phosphoribosyltransferase regulatory subunit